MKAIEILIVGGGIIGCATAYALAKRGASVTVLEQSEPGAGASSAAAGVIGAQTDATQDNPLLRLTLTSMERYPAFVEEIHAATGIDVQYRRTGVLHVAISEEELGELKQAAKWQAEAGVTVEVVDAARVRELEQAIGQAVAGGLYFPKKCRMDPPTLVQAVKIAAERKGARFRNGAAVRRVVEIERRARGVELHTGEILDANHVILTAGSWSSLIGGALRAGVVEPVRGQIVELSVPAPLFQRPLIGKQAYLSPRDDGRVLVGSTWERVGFRAGVTARAVRDMLDGALALCPDLADATVRRTWSGFRPASKTGAPLIGSTSIEGLFIATGHGSDGMVLAPLTADIVAALVAGEASPVNLAPFAPNLAMEA